MHVQLLSHPNVEIDTIPSVSTGLDQPLAARGQGYQAHQLSCPVVICELIHVDVHRGRQPVSASQVDK